MTNIVVLDLFIFIFWEFKSKEKVSKRITDPILQLDKNFNLINVFENAKIASTISKVEYSSIRKCLKGSAKTAGNFIWKYKSDYF